MKHGGTDHIKGVLHRGTAAKPSPIHGGSGLPKGKVHDASKPAPSQRSTSWHAMAAASRKRK
jgi:hypothetical protein